MNYPRNIPVKFDWNWHSGFRDVDFIFIDVRQTTTGWRRTKINRNTMFLSWAIAQVSFKDVRLCSSIWRAGIDRIFTRRCLLSEYIHKSCLYILELSKLLSFFTAVRIMRKAFTLECTFYWEKWDNTFFKNPLSV